jgi:hypothetical protein
MSVPRPTIQAAVAVARAAFDDEGIASPETDAVELAAFALGTDASDVRRRMVLRDPADEGFLDTYDGLVEERLARIPLQHLIDMCLPGVTLSNHRGFFGDSQDHKIVTALGNTRWRTELVDVEKS